MARLQIRRLGYALGAEVRGVDLSGTLDTATVAEIRSTWLEHHVLCFPEQRLSKEAFLAFGRQFGNLEDNPHARSRDPENTLIKLVSNKQTFGKPWDGYKEGVFWHSDHSYKTRPTPATFLLAKEIPDVGGDTMFANQYLAYESLSPGMKKLLDGLAAVHDLSLRPGAKHIEKRSATVLEKTERSNPPVVHPVVTTHPETGRKALYISERVRCFEGMTPEESRPLVGFLCKQAVTYECTYRHRWTVDDLIMWDNRCLMHLALVDYDQQRQIRDMWRCSTRGPQTGHLFNEQNIALSAAAG